MILSPSPDRIIRNEDHHHQSIPMPMNNNNINNNNNNNNIPSLLSSSSVSLPSSLSSSTIAAITTTAPLSSFSSYSSHSLHYPSLSSIIDNNNHHHQSISIPIPPNEQKIPESYPPPSSITGPRLPSFIEEEKSEKKEEKKEEKKPENLSIISSFLCACRHLRALSLSSSLSSVSDLPALLYANQEEDDQYSRQIRRRRIVLFWCLLPLILMVLIGGIIGLFFLYETIKTNQINHIIDNFQRNVDSLHLHIEAIFDNYEIMSDRVSSWYDSVSSASINISTHSFRRFASFVLPTGIGVQGLAWAEIIRPSDYHHYIRNEQIWRLPNDNGNPRIHPQKIPSNTTPYEYFVPVRFEEPRYPINFRVIGFDLFSNRQRREVMIEARDRCIITSTESIILAQETEEQKGIVLFSPAFNRNNAFNNVSWSPCDESIEWRRENIKGFGATVLRIADMFHDVYRQINGDYYRLLFSVYENRVNDTANYNNTNYWNRTDLLFTTVSKGHRGDIKINKTLRIANRKWYAVFESKPGYINENIGTSTKILWGTGITFLALIVITVGFVARYQYVVLQALASARDIRALRLTISAIADMVVLVDTNNHISYANQAFLHSVLQSKENVIGHSMNEFIRGLLSVTELHTIIMKKSSDRHSEQVGNNPDNNNNNNNNNNNDFKNNNNTNNNNNNRGGSAGGNNASNTFAVPPSHDPLPPEESELSQLTMDVTIMRSNHTSFPAEVSIGITPIESTIICVLIIRDTTESRKIMKKMERMRREAMEANRHKTDFLSFICHELRNPIHAITGLVDHLSSLLSEHEVEEPEASDNIDAIKSCAKQMRTIIDDVLDLHKIETGKLELEMIPTDLIKLIQSVALQTPKPSNNEVHFVIDHSQLDHRPDHDNLIFLTDPTRLMQILLNLIGNAIKFTERGTVTLTVQIIDSPPRSPIPTPLSLIPSAASSELLPPSSSAAALPTKQLILSHPSEVPASSSSASVPPSKENQSIISPLSDAKLVHVRFIVSDTGIGITEEQCHRLFQPFTQASKAITRKFGGSGLGLSIVHQLVTAMGGTIRIESKLGSGSTFIIDLRMRRITNTDQEGASLLMKPPSSMTNVGESIASGIFHERKQPRSLSKDDTKSSPRIHRSFHNELLKENTVSIPISQSLPPPPPPLPSFPSDAHHHQFILIVEDAAINRKLLLKMLHGIPYQIKVATNGAEALDIMKEEYHIACSEGLYGSDAYNRCVCILMDLVMPIMDGWEATAEIRRLGYKGAILAMSGNALKDDIEKFLDCGGTRFLSKPFNRDDIIGAIDDAKKMVISDPHPSGSGRGGGGGGGGGSSNQNIPSESNASSR